jgi:hypothetical protein
MPKVFISYSWSSPGHQEQVRHWADRLLADGIEVVLDLYDLKEGDDKYAFMESMITDASVSHVLIFCDRTYAAKADARQAGVGTESQIISQEIYNKVTQSKVIPVVTSLGENGEPFLPTFLKPRIWIDFSSSEAVNENWEQLVRVLYGRPLHQKPMVGKPPTYLADAGSSPASPAAGKFGALRQALLQSRPGIALYRKDFLDACFEYADSLRVRERPTTDSLGDKVFTDCGRLKLIRDHLIDWILLEASIAPTPEFAEALIGFLERMWELKSKPPELNQWSDAWFEAHSVFVYETFLYIVAALVKSNACSVLHEVFTTHYLRPSSDRSGDVTFDTFSRFHGHSESLQAVLAPKGHTLHSASAELIKRQADRNDLPFSAIIEAELLVLLMTMITPDAFWYPGTLHYRTHSSDSPFFLRAAQHKGFKKLAIISGIPDATRLRAAVIEGAKREDLSHFSRFRFDRGATQAMNIDNWDTIK